MEVEGRDFFSKLAAKRLQNQNVHGKDMLSSRSWLRYRMKFIGTWLTLT